MKSTIKISKRKVTRLRVEIKIDSTNYVTHVTTVRQGYKWAAWKIYPFTWKWEIGIEGDGLTSAQRRRMVNGIALELGCDRLLYPANLRCSECKTPYYYDECREEKEEMENFQSKDTWFETVFFPDPEKCKHACKCDNGFRKILMREL